MLKTVLVIGTLDTKARELHYLRQRVEAEGAQVLLMDVSCKADPANRFAEISSRTVAGEIGKEFEEITLSDKISAVNLMTNGAIRIAKRLLDQGRISAVIGLGGANGAEISCAVMRDMPIGVPKLMVTCVASGNTRPYVGTKDIFMLNSIGDISLNSITKRVMNNAAKAIAHMAANGPPDNERSRLQICISTFGTTLPCVERAKVLLEKRGFEVIELHASGSGGMALEELIKAGEVNAVLDITTSELVDDLVGGMYSAGPHRLEAAGSMGISQVVSLGALDFANFGPRETIPDRFHDRNFFFYTPSITLKRTNVEENQILGKKIADKLNDSKGPAAVIIPQKGFSTIDRPGAKRKTTVEGEDAGEWHDEEANAALILAIKNYLDTSKVTLIEMDAHINDPEFAERAVQVLIEMIDL